MASTQYGLRERKPVEPEPLTEPRKKQPPKSGAERARLYRERLKAKGQYQQYLDIKRQESQLYRDKLKTNATAEKRERIRQATRERVRKYRQQQKETGQCSQESSKVLTRRQKDKLRETNRERKRKERQSWNEQQWERHREKCRERYLKKKLENVVATPRQEASQEKNFNEKENLNEEINYSDTARNKALQRVCAKLPKDTGKKQLVIQDFFKRFQKVKTEKSEKQKTKESNKSGTKTPHLNLDKQTKRKLAASIAVSKYYKKTLANKFNISRMYLSRIQKQDPKILRRPSEKSLARHKDVTKFYLRPDISTPLSEKKKVKKGRPAFSLTKPLDDLYKEYIQEVDSPVSRSVFKKLRPKNVKLASSELLNQCLCDICENVSLKIGILDRYLAPEKKIKNIYNISNLMLCDKGDRPYHDLECIEESCSACGKSKLLNHILNEVTDHQGEQVAWRRWSLMEKKKKLITKTGTLLEMIMETLDDTHLFPFHLFKAKWQQKEFSTVKAFPPPDSCVTVLDFAENYRCTMQDEIQAAHWSYEQVTIHPFVSYYGCQECQRVVTHVVAVISDDLRHDSTAVSKFLEAFYKHMGNKNIHFRRHIQWSDGCSCQYKSKRPFFDLAETSRKSPKKNRKKLFRFPSWEERL